MAPSVNVFKSTLKWMKISGTVYSPGRPNALFEIWKYVMILCHLETIVVAILGIMTRDLLNTKLESVALVFLCITMITKHISFLLKQHDIIIIINRMNTLLEEVEMIYGKEVTAKLFGMCNSVTYSYCGVVVITLSLMTIFSFYRYYVLGLEDAIPFETYVPFERKNNLYKGLMFDYVTFMPPATFLVMTNSFFGAIAISASEIIAKIRKQFMMLNETNFHDVLKQTVQWHTEIIKIIAKINSLFGYVFIVEYIAAIIYLSLAAFLLVKFGTTDEIKFYKYIIIYIALMIVPIFFCLWGHVISDQSEKLSIMLYSNNWYLLKTDQRKNLILPGMLASKELSLNYRGYVKFDMATYLFMLRQSFSVLAVLKMLDKN